MTGLHHKVFQVCRHIGFEGKEAANELPRKVAIIGNGIISMKLRNGKEQVREIYWVNSPEIEQPRMFLLGYELKRFLDLSKLHQEELRIIVGIPTNH